MIPRAVRSRDQLRVFYLNKSEGGTHSVYLQRDVYPLLFEHAFGDLVACRGSGWRPSQTGKTRGMFFDLLTADEVERIEAWEQRFREYVVLGLNDHIEPHFSSELDFCMALGYRFDMEGQRRTPLGELEYQAKYRRSEQARVSLVEQLAEAVTYLPLEPEAGPVCLTYVPPEPGRGAYLPRWLVTAVAAGLADGALLLAEPLVVDAELAAEKPSMKNLSIGDKIETWQEIYAGNGAKLSGSVQGRQMIVVDDLYQSGATLWSYAGFLKKNGATVVFGLACVKSMRDTDNL